ncbi:MAG: N-acetylmuramoyl-L-alanine amidase [Pelomonas sp.]|nr:N-acetylmuramoyl-L-alanine amidase [Roseateles sp.]
MKKLLASLLVLLLTACASGPYVDREFPSANQDSRAQYLILHYTVTDWPKSLKVLTSGGQVSAHYLVRDDPARIYQLVDENRRAWHAGLSYWAGATNLNSASIGIEIVNPGWVDTPNGRVYAPFPKAQMDQVVALVKDIVKRQGIRPDHILGHEEIAPGRKQDPGPQFPWKRFADEGIIPWPDAAQVAAKQVQYADTLPDAAWVQDRLGRFGYEIAHTGQDDRQTHDVIATFQAKYRASKDDGQLDAETAALIDVATTPGGMVLAKPAAQP